MAMVLGTAFAAVSQNNDFGIKDRLYAIYEKAVLSVKTKEGKVLIDSLYTESVRMGDRKAQCIAQSLRLRNATSSRLRTARSLVEAEAEKLRKLSAEYGYNQYYYYAYQLEIIWMLNVRFTNNALTLAQKEMKEAMAAKNDNGIYTAYFSMGDVYMARGNYDAAIGAYRKAAEYRSKHPNTYLLSGINLRIALAINRSCGLSSCKRREEALKYAENAVATSNSVSSLVAALEGKAEILYYLNRIDDFNETYNRMVELEKKHNYKPENNRYYKVRVLKAIVDKRFDDAEALCPKVSGIDRPTYRRFIAIARGDYKSAMEYTEQVMAVRDSIDNSILKSDLAEYNAVLDNEMLSKRNMELDLENSRLLVEQSQRQIELERTRADNKTLELENVSLEMNRVKAQAEATRLHAEKLKADKQRSAQALEVERSRSRAQVAIATSVAVVLIAIALMLVLLIIRRHRMMLTIEKKNHELSDANIKTEAALQDAVEARQRAEEANKMKVRFMQNMSHEIRTPLNSIVGFTQLLSESGAEFSVDERREFSRLIEQNSALLTNMVNDILCISDMESGNYTINNATTSCNMMGRDALTTVEYRCPSGVQLRFSSDVPDEFTIVTDPQRVQQVLINLLTNAEKYTEQGEIHLQVSQSENPGRITYSVTDTGTGIPAEQAEAIFERFRKLDSFKQGCGLGLNICRIMADRLNGDVRLDTSYTGGARFVFVLPLVPPEA